jgi:hypothetical protein
MNWIILILALVLGGQAHATDWCADDNVKGCWLFSDGSGTTLTDSSGNSNNGSFASLNHPAWSSEKPKSYVRNSVLYGSGDAITVSGGMLGGETSSTIVFWIKPISTTVTPLNNNWGSGWLITNNGTRPYFASKSTGGETFIYAQDKNWSTSNWQHIACVRNSGSSPSVWFYYDTLLATSNVITQKTGGLVSTSPLTIGDSNSGYMTEIAMFNRVLSSTEISEIYDYGLSPTATGTYSIIRNSIIRNSIIR